MLRSALASLADHLLAHEMLEGEQVQEIVGDWLGSCWQTQSAILTPPVETARWSW
jgi:hypothetical protein